MERMRYVVVCAWLLAGCKEGTAPVIAPVPSEILSAPEEIVVRGVTVRLDTYLWRDFQPVSPPDGKPLIAVLRLKSTDGKAIPSGLRVGSVWVVNGDSAWMAEARQEHPPADSAEIEFVAREGPKWGPGITVDVVIRVRDATGDPRLLRATAQPIYRTD
ncbi:MAG TPA: hypothetical protein VE201_08925 [Nitrospirales bacterium]|jgi:hypothetical protein|nr:hypothetical protein [Nitrospirales bacterium]